MGGDIKTVSLPSKKKCTSTFIDLGASIGVQVRKLVAEMKNASSVYKDAMVKKRVREYFGDNNGTLKMDCVMMVEPNTMLNERLLETRDVMQAAEEGTNFIVMNSLMVAEKNAKDNTTTAFFIDPRSNLMNYGSSTSQWMGDDVMKVRQDLPAVAQSTWSELFRRLNITHELKEINQTKGVSSTDL